MLQRITALGVLASCLGCQPRASGAAAAPSPESCRRDRASLIELLESLPDKGLGLRGRADLPVASLGGVIGAGRVLDIDGDSLALDGRRLDGESQEARSRALAQSLEAGAEPTPESPGVPRPLLYVAASASLDVRTLRQHLAVIPRSYDVQLVFQAPAPDRATLGSGAQVSERLLSEPDLPTRHGLAREAYREHARCESVQKAVDGVGAGDPTERWPALRTGLLGALPECDCQALDTEPLRELLLAEQRAGAAVVGSVPVDFMRDERCGASFGLNPVQKVLDEIQAFDEQFAGQYGQESLDFAQVVTNERLLNYLCPALPGETLAALSRARQTLYWKVRGVEQCQAWRLEPLEPGSNMGTWRRQGNENAPLAIHYWQGAEEIRLFGPVQGPGSKPTDEHTWACNQEFKMRGIDPSSIELESGRWFFERAACQRASEGDAAFPGCIQALAGGPPEAPPAVPATFPALGDGHPETTAP
jgi:hypothetical protein